MQYGIPYMGSKDGIALKVLQYIPTAENFYDLFGGGFSITHAAMTLKTKRWMNFHFNEIGNGTVTLIKDAISGKYNYNVFKPEFINREKFQKDKQNCAYTRIIWSFGNDQNSYIFGTDIEKQKESLHNAVVFGVFDEFAEKIIGTNSWRGITDITERRLFIKKMIRQYKLKVRYDLERLQQLERLQRLQRLQQLEQLERLKFYSTSYENIEIKDNSVVYCDPPYRGTAKYGNIEFDHDRFFNWADKADFPVYISEYSADSRFKCIATIRKRQLLSSNKSTKGDYAQEKIFINKFVQRTKSISNY